MAQLAVESQLNQAAGAKNQTTHEYTHAGRTMYNPEGNPEARSKSPPPNYLSFHFPFESIFN